jgi:hypothetical protein
MADGTWPNLLGKFKPHADRHTQSTWIDVLEVPKVIQMDRRGHVMQGMDAVYTHVTPEMRQQLCDYLEKLWQQGVAGRYAMAPRSAVPILNDILIAHEKSRQAKRQPKARDAKRERAAAVQPSEVVTRARRQQARQAGRGQSRG